MEPNLQIESSGGFADPEAGRKILVAPRRFDLRASRARPSALWSWPGLQLTAQIAAIGAGVVLVVAVVGWNLLLIGAPTLPPANDLWTLNRQPAVQFVDASGKTLAVRGHLYGPIFRSAELPAYVGQAFIAAEDQRFMAHGGVDARSIVRATFANLSAGRVVQGGSTLTQQLVKNLLVGNAQSLQRKAQEAHLATQMEKELSKREILDLYLNRVYLGSNAYGVEAAAEAYFGKPAAELSLAEAAFLGALPKAPSRYAENRTGAKTVARVHYVLDRMVESRFVTPQAAAAAKTQQLQFVGEDQGPPLSGYVLDRAIEEARTLAPDLPADAVIALTVDKDVQRQAEMALNATLSVRGLGADQGAVVVLDHEGEIRALVGGRQYEKSQFNRATQALRQPGSAFKTFVYASALEHGLTPSEFRNDAPVQLAGWQPGNYEGNYRGPITLAKALAISSNSVAVQIGSEVGPQQVADLAKRFGINSPLRPYPSIALGTDEVTLLDLTSAYGVLANGGRRRQAHLVAEIRNQGGEVLYSSAEHRGEAQVYSDDNAATLTGMLSNVVLIGTGGQARVPGWQIAGKTGTSQSWRDAWFVGYSARLVAGVWIGNDDDRATTRVTGGGAAAAVFAKVMIAAHRGLKPEPLRGAELGALWLDAVLEGELPEEVSGDQDASRLGDTVLANGEANVGPQTPAPPILAPQPVRPDREPGLKPAPTILPQSTTQPPAAPGEAKPIAN